MGGGLAITIAVLILAPGEEPPVQVTSSTAAIGSPPASTSPTDPAASFVVSFRVAIDAQDVDFLMEHLHPVVTDTYGQERCRSFVIQEILQLENYVQTGDAIGPIIRAFQTAMGSTVAQTYEVPVAFDYRGQHYEDTALFGLSGETMHWFGECR